MGEGSILTVIRSFDSTKFSIAIVQDAKGRYSVVYSTGDADEYTQWTDYHTAAYTFDLKLQELEGN